MLTNRWKLAAGSALLALCSYAALAQQDAPPPGPPPDGPQAGAEGPGGGFRGPERELRMLTRSLDLTADQQTGVKAVLQQQATQMKALRAKFESESADNATPETRQAHRTQVEQIRDETDTKISALLNEPQKAKFSQWVARRKAMMARHAGGDGNAPPPPPDGPGDNQ